MNSKITRQLSNIVTQFHTKNPYSVIIGLMALVILVPSAIVMFLQIKNLSSMNSQIKNIAEEIRTTQNNILRLDQFKKDISHLNHTLEKINFKVKSKDDIPLILENISRMSNRYGVRVEQMMPHSSLDQPILENINGRYYALPITMESESGYHNFGRFLSHIEAEGSFIEVPEFVIAAKAGTPRLQAVKLTLQAVIFETAE